MASVGATANRVPQNRVAAKGAGYWFIGVVCPHNDQWTFVITEGEYLFGRNRVCDFRVADGKVSRLHALFSAEKDGSLFVSDMRSASGTKVNGSRIKSQEAVQLAPGDCIRVGASTLTVHVWRLRLVLLL